MPIRSCGGATLEGAGVCMPNLRAAPNGEKSLRAYTLQRLVQRRFQTRREISCSGDRIRNETGQFQCDVEPPVGVASDAPAELQCAVRVLGPS
jgi:hypothetical protein